MSDEKKKITSKIEKQIKAKSKKIKETKIKKGKFTHKGKTKKSLTLHYDRNGRRKKPYKAKAVLREDGDPITEKGKKLKITKDEKDSGVTKARKTDRYTKVYDYKEVRRIDSEKILKKFPIWQVCAHTWIKEGNKIIKTFSVGKTQFTPITELKVRKQIKLLIAQVEKYYDPVKMNFFIRYWEEKTKRGG